MKALSKKEILAAWRESALLGIDFKKEVFPQKPIILSECEEKIKKVFNQTVCNFNILRKNVSEGILLINKNCITIDAVYFGANINIDMFTDFHENEVGINAINLSIRKRKEIYMISSDNYTSFLQNFSIYSMPIKINELVYGTIAYISLDCDLFWKDHIVLKLLHDLIQQQLVMNNDNKVYQNSFDLNERQVEILYELSQGNTDKEIAFCLGLNINTVRYHKKNIFRKLDCMSSLEAVIKAIKYNVISV